MIINISMKICFYITNNKWEKWNIFRNSQKKFKEISQVFDKSKAAKLKPWIKRKSFSIFWKNLKIPTNWRDLLRCRKKCWNVKHFQKRQKILCVGAKIFTTCILESSYLINNGTNWNQLASASAIATALWLQSNTLCTTLLTCVSVLFFCTMTRATENL